MKILFTGIVAVISISPRGSRTSDESQLRELYTGPHALPCPSELLGWLDNAILLHDVIVRQQAIREAREALQ